MRPNPVVTERAVAYAKQFADREILRRIQNGQLDSSKIDLIKSEYQAVYQSEYYKFFAVQYQNLNMSMDQQSKIVYIATDNLHCKRYYRNHSVVKFTRLNCFLRVNNKKSVTISRLNFALDDETDFIETMESFLPTWPGPLDRTDDDLKRKLTNYVDTLWQHDSQRKIRYIVKTYDDQRKTILKLLIELLHRNGTIDPPCVTRLLVHSDETEIQKGDSSRHNLDNLQKYLLLGKRGEAIRYARNKRLWDHAQCLAFLDKYQPNTNYKYHTDNSKLKDDSIVQLNEEYITSLDPGHLKTVYMGLLGRIYASYPDPENIFKPPSIGDDEHKFAMLSANDCEMIYDQSNEVFNLIMAVKRIFDPNSNSRNHLISLGINTTDNVFDDTEDSSINRSHVSFGQIDNETSKTLTISNMDLTLLNEIWEYCLNIARGTNNPINYEYIIDLVPYKLVLASKLLDYGLHKMFGGYLQSIKSALDKARGNPNRDQSYDWHTIEESVDMLDQIWQLFLTPSSELHNYVPPKPPAPLSVNNDDYDPISQHYSPSIAGYNSTQRYDTAQYDSLPYQHQQTNDLVTTNQFNHANQYDPYETQSNLYDPNAFSPSTYDQPGTSEVDSRKTSIDTTAYPPPPNNMDKKLTTTSHSNFKSMHSSSPVNKRESLQSNFNPITDSFNALSPINDNDDLPSRPDVYEPLAASTSATSDPPIYQQQHQLQNAWVPPTNNHQMPPAHLQSQPQSQSRQSNPPSSTSNNNANSNPGAFGQTKSTLTSQAADDNDSSRANNNNNNINDNNDNNPTGNQNSATLTSQRSGIFSGILDSAKGMLKSNSKQMILPDDSKQQIVWDEASNSWINTNPNESQDGLGGPPEPPKRPPARPSEPSSAYGKPRYARPTR